MAKHLHMLKSIRRLKLSKVKCGEVHEMLEKMGSRLTHLELVSARECFDLSAIANHCPQMHTFEIFYSMAVNLSFVEDFSLPSLKKLTIYCTDIRGFNTAQVVKYS